MPAQKSKKAAKPATGRATSTQPQAAAKSAKTAVKSGAKAQPAETPAKAKTVPASKTTAKTEKATKTAKATASETKKAAAVSAEDAVAKKKPGRPPKAAAAESSAPPAKTGAKRGRKPKAAAKSEDDEDLLDIEAEFAEEPVEVEASGGEKAKPLRMKISKAKERALMKEFGLDETVLSEEDLAKRRQRLKARIKLGKTRGYLTHGEISDHLPDKLVDAETLEVVISMLNDMGVAVYEQTPDAETLLLNNTGPTAASEEEAEEEAEAALSTVDSEFGRTTDPVRMYMREMGTVELLTREGEIAPRRPRSPKSCAWPTKSAKASC